jgi:hypothetical protein
MNLEKTRLPKDRGKAIDFSQGKDPNVTITDGISMVLQVDETRLGPFLEG